MCRKIVGIMAILFSQFGYAGILRFECPVLLRESRVLSPSATMDTFIMDRRQDDAANYEYGYVGVGVLDRKSGRFFAELPDDPESAELNWTIGVDSEYYLACQEKGGAFLFAERIQGPGACRVDGQVFNCTFEPNP